MTRVAAIAWLMAALLLAGLVAHLASEGTPTCAADPAATVACVPASVAEAVAAPLLQVFLWPVWAPLVGLAYLLGRHPTRARAIGAAATGILGAPTVVWLIALLGGTSEPRGLDAHAIAVGLLLCVPGVLSAFAAFELGSASLAVTQQGQRRWSPFAP